MSRTKVSISLPEDLLQRIDAIADARGDSRSYVMAKVLEAGIASQEQFLRDMENPVIRGFARVLANSPDFVKEVLSIGESQSSEEFARLLDRVPEQIKRGKERQMKGKNGSRGGERRDR